MVAWSAAMGTGVRMENVAWQVAINRLRHFATSSACSINYTNYTSLRRTWPRDILWNRSRAEEPSCQRSRNYTPNSDVCAWPAASAARAAAAALMRAHTNASHFICDCYFVNDRPPRDQRSYCRLPSYLQAARRADVCSDDNRNLSMSEDVVLSFVLRVTAA